jgi:hypothetical protein
MTRRNTSKRAAHRAATASVLFFALGAATATAGCTNGPRPPASAIKEGELGNGGFTFTCDDSVVCAKYTNTAQNFPKAVALGATFRAQFVPNPGTDVDVSVSRTQVDVGVDGKQSAYSIDGVGRTWLSRGPEGLAALKPGYATITAKNSLGQLVDYAVIRIAAPDAIVVYDGSFKAGGSAPARITAINMKVGERRTFRALARAKNEDLAGSVRFDWKSLDDGVLQVESVTEGTVTVLAKAVGKTALSTEGASMVSNTDAEVTQ